MAVATKLVAELVRRLPDDEDAHRLRNRTAADAGGGAMQQSEAQRRQARHAGVLVRQTESASDFAPSGVARPVAAAIPRHDQ